MAGRSQSCSERYQRGPKSFASVEDVGYVCPIVSSKKIATVLFRILSSQAVKIEFCLGWDAPGFASVIFCRPRE
jgi:hypothetical protein